VEPCPVGSAEDVFGAVGRVCEGDKGWVVGEVGRVGPRRRIRDRQRTGGGKKKKWCKKCPMAPRWSSVKGRR
jgi:hypothetical protein